MRSVKEIAQRPVVVCLCGSTRFYEWFERMNLVETCEGNIVLSVGCNTKSDAGLGLSPEDKERLDTLHLRKIDLADEILVINPGYYIGSSTAREIVYAWQRGKGIRWLERPPYVAYPYRSPYGESVWCDEATCSERAAWWCVDGEFEAGFFCGLHAFRYGRPVEGE
jgi:hypothetical protein